MPSTEFVKTMARVARLLLLFYNAFAGWSSLVARKARFRKVKFVAYGSVIHMVETERRQRKPKSAEYRDAWNLILQWATREETRDA